MNLLTHSLLKTKNQLAMAPPPMKNGTGYSVLISIIILLFKNKKKILGYGSPGRYLLSRV